MKKFSIFTIGILAGAAIGVGVCLLLAKEKNKSTRDKITRQFSRLQETLSEYFTKTQSENETTKL